MMQTNNINVLQMFIGLNYTIFWVLCLKQVMALGHIPVNVKRAVIGSKGGWKLSTIFFSCKVFHDWSIIKLGNILYLLDRSIFSVLFGTTSHCFC